MLLSGGDGMRGDEWWGRLRASRLGQGSDRGVDPPELQLPDAEHERRLQKERRVAFFPAMPERWCNCDGRARMTAARLMCVSVRRRRL